MSDTKYYCKFCQRVTHHKCYKCGLPVCYRHHHVHLEDGFVMRLVCDDCEEIEHEMDSVQ